MFGNFPFNYPHLGRVAFNPLEFQKMVGSPTFSNFMSEAQIKENKDGTKINGFAIFNGSPQEYDILFPARSLDGPVVTVVKRNGGSRHEVPAGLGLQFLASAAPQDAASVSAASLKAFSDSIKIAEARISLASQASTTPAVYHSSRPEGNKPSRLDFILGTGGNDSYHVGANGITVTGLRHDHFDGAGGDDTVFLKGGINRYRIGSAVSNTGSLLYNYIYDTKTKYHMGVSNVEYLQFDRNKFTWEEALKRIPGSDEIVVLPPLLLPEPAERTAPPTPIPTPTLTPTPTPTENSVQASVLEKLEHEWTMTKLAMRGTASEADLWNAFKRQLAQRDNPPSEATIQELGQRLGFE